jgi:hypothetical protein
METTTLYTTIVAGVALAIWFGIQIHEWIARRNIIGKKYFFRTVTYHMTGRVVAIIGNIIQLEDAAWIADSGRFSDAIKTGELSEIEPTGNHFINLDTCTDFIPWNHELPRVQK